MKSTITFLLLSIPFLLLSQGRIDWAPDGTGLRESQKNTIVKITLPNRQVDTLINAALLIPKGQSKPLQVRSFEYSADKLSGLNVVISSLICILNLIRVGCIALSIFIYG